MHVAFGKSRYVELAVCLYAVGIMGCKSTTESEKLDRYHNMRMAFFYLIFEESEETAEYNSRHCSSNHCYVKRNYIQLLKASHYQTFKILQHF